MSTQVLDPFDVATQAAERADSYFGRISVDAQFVSLRKGQGKQVWDGVDVNERRTEVTLILNPLDCTGLTRNVERSVIAESREFSAVVWPSLRDLGLKNIRELAGKWAWVELAKSGRTWTNKEGATVEGTTFKFIALYGTEAEAIKGWESQFGGSQPASNGAAAAAVSQNNDAERATALQFLPAVVAANKHDLSALANTLANMSPLNRYFSINSPEVIALLAA